MKQSLPAALKSRWQGSPLPAWLGTAGQWPGLPLLLLLLTLSTVFVFAGDRGTFYRPGHHDAVTANYLSVAANLSLEHRLLGFYTQAREADGTRHYQAYNRFPVGGYLLIKLFTGPFGDNVAAQIYAARMLMLLFFCGAAALAYLSLSRLTDNRWIALTATAFAFAAPYWLYYNDMVAIENAPDFFGAMLAFHGMVVFRQEGRFRQLLVKSCLALLLGWHGYALLLVFVLLGLVSELWRERAAARPAYPLRRILVRIRAGLGRLVRSRFLALGIVTLLFGGALLSFNLVNEYLAFGGERELSQLPTYRSIKFRSSLTTPDRIPRQLFSSQPGQPNYLEEQFHRIGGLSVPYALSGFFNDWSPFPLDDRPGQSHILGIAATGLCLLGLLWARRKLLWATLFLFGFAWALPMNNYSAFHDYDSVFYTGIPLTAISFLLLYLSRPGGRRFIAAFAAAALLLFGVSSFQMAKVGYAADAAQAQKVAMADLQTIRHLTQDGTVQYVGRLPELSQPVQYYLARSLRARNQPADFIIMPLRLDLPELLTPQNRRVFLYRGGPGAAQRYIDHILEQAGPPLARATFDIYWYQDQYGPYANWLFYVKEPCAGGERVPPFLLHLTPADTADLPPERWQRDFDNLDFEYRSYGWLGQGRCVAGRPLPDYPIVHISAGQYWPGAPALWRVEFAVK